MIDSTVTEVDFIKELRLRSWARRNYMPAHRRSDSWHPIVLDEMAAKDVISHGDQGVSCHTLESAYVPILPADIRIFHSSHTSHSEPNLIGEPSLSTSPG